MTPTTEALVATYRKAAAAERDIRYRIDRGTAGTRNGRATDACLRHHAETQCLVVERLCLAGKRRLIGLLVEEASLAERLRVAPDRPELRRRLLAVRRELRRRPSEPS